MWFYINFSALLNRKTNTFVFLTLFLFLWHQCFHVPYSALTMFISSEQKERDSATAYSEYHSWHVKWLHNKCTPHLLWLNDFNFRSGMMVEVLGTVLGTAIQGQIVGMANAPCLPGPGEILAGVTNSSNSGGLNGSEPVISLEHTVNKLSKHKHYRWNLEHWCQSVNQNSETIVC